MKLKVIVLALASLLAGIILTGCGESKSDTLKNSSIKDSESIAAIKNSKPGDIISSGASVSTDEELSCDGEVDHRVLVNNDALNGKIEVAKTSIGKPFKISLVTLDPTRISLSGSQYTLIHTQRGVNIMCLVYDKSGKFMIKAEEEVLLNIDVTDKK